MSAPSSSTPTVEESSNAVQDGVAPKKVKPPRKKPAKTGTPKAKASAVAGGESPQQQKQRDKEFLAHKAHIQANLQSNACDLSPKGSVDVKCLPVMAVLNTHNDYITTSSCSGRIALFHSIGRNDAANGTTEPGDDVDPSPTPKSRMKRGDDAALGWVFVKHGMLRPEEMAQVVRFLCGPAQTAEEAALDATQLATHTARMAAIVKDEASTPQSTGLSPSPAGMFDGEVEGALVESPADAPLPPPTRGTVSVKMEPFVMHVECRTMEAAKQLLSAAVSDSGYRNSGVVPPGRKIMCGIRSTVGLGLDVPVVLHGVNHVATQRAYVWALLELANEKMEANEKKIKLLERSVAARLAAQQKK